MVLIGRIRNRDMVQQAVSQSWTGCKTRDGEAMVRAQALGAFDYVGARPASCHLVLVKPSCHARYRRRVPGHPVRSKLCQVFEGAEMEKAIPNHC